MLSEDCAIIQAFILGNTLEVCYKYSWNAQLIDMVTLIFYTGVTVILFLLTLPRNTLNDVHV